MKIVILAAGRIKDGAEQAHLARYVSLFDAAARPLRLPPLEIVEIAESRAANTFKRKQDEAATLIAKLPSGGRLAALDEKGDLTTSRAFAHYIQEAREDAVSTLAFAIGGPDGHGDVLLAQAENRISLGHITLPHALARIILAEQLYRALTILQGHPYHRD